MARSSRAAPCPPAAPERTPLRGAGAGHVLCMEPEATAGARPHDAAPPVSKEFPMSTDTNVTDRPRVEPARGDDAAIAAATTATPPSLTTERPAAERRFGRRIECEARGALRESPHGPGARRG